MIEIDGSYGEGGGQLLRMALAFSSILEEPIRVLNIRAKRSNPGIRPQHLAAIESVVRLTGGTVKGNKVGSSSIEYFPKRPEGGHLDIDVGTAGSITLILQALLPIAVMAKREVSGTIRGGTEVKWSPTVDYFDMVFLQALRDLGINVEMKLVKSGYYPRGGGIVKFRVQPTREIKPLILLENPSEIWVDGVSRCQNLPGSVAERQAAAASKFLRERGLHVKSIEVVSGEEALNPGSSITLWARGTSEIYVGGDALGERGKAAELVGEEAASKLFNFLRAAAPVDEHAADMLLPYLILARDESRVRISNASLHLLTETHLANLFGRANVSLTDEKPPTLVVRPL